MEERRPPSDDAKDLSLPLPPPPRPAHLETYVVQIPRDQIYRIPPPEHARIVEDHTRNSTLKNKSPRNTFFLIALPVLLVGLIAVIAVLAIRATLYNPTSPEFAVTSFQGKNSEYDVTLRVKSTNPRMSVSLQGGGQASLYFKNQKIGKGGIRSTVEEDPNGGGAAVDVPLVLSGKGMILSKEIKKRLNDTSEKSMALKMETTVEMNSWLRNEQINLKITCDLKVKKTRISFQECHTENQAQ
ncbi:hypothetical protein CDL12_00476 [Handroanthus impetiginosus]|uniref:Late embryogenesis abundant protein LEA-2 subgroup domain-containing protein n=1 Tax=Handroanthus impetiginosus TaxID=429701 RepID=A0A2G9IAI5_9LAMI|nr:hypothetical protein CDL12_00476 [Handroanthus impetiginosus]